LKKEEKKTGDACTRISPRKTSPSFPENSEPNTMKQKQKNQKRGGTRGEDLEAGAAPWRAKAAVNDTPGIRRGRGKWGGLGERGGQLLGGQLGNGGYRGHCA